MKIIELIWRDPAGNIMSEKLDAEKFQVEAERGWLRLFDTSSVGKPLLVRLIPSEKVCLVQFAEVEDKPRILRPNLVSDTPNKFQPS